MAAGACMPLVAVHLPLLPFMSLLPTPLLPTFGGYLLTMSPSVVFQTLGRLLCLLATPLFTMTPSRPPSMLTFPTLRSRLPWAAPGCFCVVLHRCAVLCRRWPVAGVAQAGDRLWEGGSAAPLVVLLLACEPLLVGCTWPAGPPTVVLATGPLLPPAPSLVGGWGASMAAPCCEPQRPMLAGPYPGMPYPACGRRGMNP